MRITGRNRDLIRKALAHAIALIEHLEEQTTDDSREMEELLRALDGDSFIRNHETPVWRMQASGYLRYVAYIDPDAPQPSPNNERPKVVPIRPQEGPAA